MLSSKSTLSHLMIFKGKGLKHTYNIHILWKYNLFKATKLVIAKLLSNADTIEHKVFEKKNRVITQSNI